MRVVRAVVSMFAMRKNRTSLSTHTLREIRQKCECEEWGDSADGHVEKFSTFDAFGQRRPAREQLMW
jgi:hypothetical protein